MRLFTLLAVSIACGSVPIFAQPSALTVDTSSRDEVRQFYRAIYFASENVPIAWTGSYAMRGALPDFGDTSPAFKEATRLRINFYRALTGVPADIRFDTTLNVKAQQAAFMMSANNALNHNPPPTWQFYTADGADAAANSNIATGYNGAPAIDGYIADAGAANDVVGHRRWLLYPQTLRMGTGDISGGGVNRPPTNAVWVVHQQAGQPPGSFGSTRPATRTREVAYPPAGYVPYTLVWPRWSFSHPDANFSSATVTMTRNGQPVPVRLERVSPNAGGEPTLVWAYDGLDTDSEAPHNRPAADTTYTVTIRNVALSTGGTRDFTYNVIVFDPDRAGSEPAINTIAGPASPAVGVANSYTVTRPTYATAFQWRTVQSSPAVRTYDAEGGAGALLISTSAGYDVVQSDLAASGRSSFRLAHIGLRTPQSLRIPDAYLVGSNTTLTFQSRLAIVTANQTAHVQVSMDDGASWIDVYTQVGSSPPNQSAPALTEAQFTPRTISLAAFAGRTVNVRFMFSMPANGQAYLPGPDVGWYIDDIALNNARVVTATTPMRVESGSTFSFTPVIVGATSLQVRSILAGAYPTEWGPVAGVNVTSNPGSNTSFLANLSVRTGTGSPDAPLTIGFAVGGGRKTLLVRAVGPTLAAFGVNGAVADPKFDLYNSDRVVIGTNDNWNIGDAPVFGGVGAFAFTDGSKDAALVTSVTPSSYTAQIASNTGAPGIALVELYDAAGGDGARLTNVSARTFVGTGDDILVAGFNIQGTGKRRLLIRAVGPTLGVFGVPGTLADPKLEIYAGANKIAENDNWAASAGATFSSVGAFQLNAGSADAALVVELEPGTYTAQITGVGGATGVALVEVYELP